MSDDASPEAALPTNPQSHGAPQPAAPGRPTAARPSVGALGFSVFAGLVVAANVHYASSSLFEPFAMAMLPERVLGFEHTRWILRAWTIALLLVGLSPILAGSRAVQALWLLFQPVVFCVALLHSCGAANSYEFTIATPVRSAPVDGFEVVRTLGCRQVAWSTAAGYLASWGTMPSRSARAFIDHTAAATGPTPSSTPPGCGEAGEGFREVACTRVGLGRYERCFVCAPPFVAGSSQVTEHLALGPGDAAFAFTSFNMDLQEWHRLRVLEAPRAPMMNVRSPSPEFGGRSPPRATPRTLDGVRERFGHRAVAYQASSEGGQTVGPFVFVPPLAEQGPPIARAETDVRLCSVQFDRLGSGACRSIGTLHVGDELLDATAFPRVTTYLLTVSRELWFVDADEGRVVHEAPLPAEAVRTRARWTFTEGGRLLIAWGESPCTKRALLFDARGTSLSCAHDGGPVDADPAHMLVIDRVPVRPGACEWESAVAAVVHLDTCTRSPSVSFTGAEVRGDVMVGFAPGEALVGVAPAGGPARTVRIPFPGWRTPGER